MKLSLCEPDNNKVNNRSGILQYDEYQDPHYMTVHHPCITTRIINNPHESHKTLFRHDQYFQALNRQLENQYRNELTENFYLHQEEKKYFLEAEILQGIFAHHEQPISSF